MHEACLGKTLSVQGDMGKTAHGNRTASTSMAEPHTVQGQLTILITDIIHLMTNKAIMARFKVISVLPINVHRLLNCFFNI